MLVMRVADIDRTSVAAVGGKGANLGEVARIDGVRVPDGFCVTTEAFRRAVADEEAVRALGPGARAEIERLPLPPGLAEAIADEVSRLGEHAAYAVRSSATAEDSPAASFAGQLDSYLDVVGAEAIGRHVSRCWGSLYGERAVAYRLRNGDDDGGAEMAVVVQLMVHPRAAGVLFTADPVSANRRVVSIEATPGLGEALVAGRVNPDVYTLRDGALVDRRAAGEPPALTDAEAVTLAGLGRRIERHFGTPQDIEWCLADDGFHVVQARPITTLFPVPAAADGESHVYVSVGHQQMMTDAMRPLGLSLWQATAGRPMHEAGGRLFVDVTPDLASPARRERVLTALNTSDPLIGDALRAVLERDGFIRRSEEDGPAGPIARAAATPPIETDPDVVARLVEGDRAALAALRSALRDQAGPALLDLILADVQALKGWLFDPGNLQPIMAAMEATAWLNRQLEEWLGERSVADTLTQSSPHNVTAEMGLTLMDVADAIRPHAEVVAFLERVEADAGEAFLDGLADLPGGTEARAAIATYLEAYGMRCAGEIDITRPRWSERPSTLVPSILSNVRTFAPGEAERRFQRGREQALRKQQEVLDRLRALPDGEAKALKTERMIDRVRTFIGYREYPKYAIVCRFAAYKQALLDEARRLVEAGALPRVQDSFYLTLGEFREVARTHRLDGELIRERREAFRRYATLEPPRVLTSEGEIVTGRYRRDDLPPGALAGLAVSAGTVEGRARVIVDLTAADLEPGDILVTAYTDPSWTPLFVAIAGLVTEVGGLMTHGAVIAREYGLPAVVGVEGATRRIRDGQRIRLHATDGYVELLA